MNVAAVIFVLAGILGHGVSAAPQSTDPVLQAAIDSVFNTQATAPPRSGPGTIVTPVPNFVPTIVPQTLVSNTGEQCTCVPYHMCDPMTNTTRGPSPVNNGGSNIGGGGGGNGATQGPNEQDLIDGFGQIDIRFDPDDCQDVLDVCCRGANRKEETVSVPPVATKPNRAAGCGIRNVGGIDFQITGAFNNEAGFGEFPWTVALIRIDDDACLCGGSLIHPKAVLTGNHCVRDYIYKANELKIRAGEWDTQTTKERLPYQERVVSRIFSHPEYNPRNLANDVALVELEDPFQLDDHISTVCLPPQGFVPNSPDCFASGWGKNEFGKQGIYSVIMKKVPLPIVPFQQCQSALQQTRLTSKFQLHPSFICAGGQAGVDTCQGDGGAPLVCPIGRRTDNRYVQCGIVAWGIGCNDAIPAVYASVSLARGWIDGQMGVLGLGSTYYSY